MNNDGKPNSMVKDFTTTYKRGKFIPGDLMAEQYGLKDIIEYNRILSAAEFYNKNPIPVPRVFGRHRTTGEYCQAVNLGRFTEWNFAEYAFLLSTDWLPVYVDDLTWEEEVIIQKADMVESMLEKELKSIKKEAVRLNKEPVILFNVPDRIDEPETQEIAMTGYSLKENRLVQISGSMYDYRILGSNRGDIHIFCFSDTLYKGLGFKGLEYPGSPAQTYRWRIPDTPAAWDRMPKHHKCNTVIEYFRETYGHKNAEKHVNSYLIGIDTINSYKGTDLGEEPKMRQILRSIFNIEDTVLSLPHAVGKVSLPRADRNMAYIEICLGEKAGYSFLSYMAEKTVMNTLKKITGNKGADK